jgi:hypothetical protein
MLYAAILRSSAAHGRIRSIEWRGRDLWAMITAGTAPRAARPHAAGFVDFER